jgi:hypothetical protein
MMKSLPCSRRQHESRRIACDRRYGSILLVVLVIIMLLSLAAYTFTELMIVEYESTYMYGRGVQAEALADSGIETVAALLQSKSEYGSSRLYHAPDLFQGVTVKDAETSRGRGRFHVVAPKESDSTSRAIRFGLVNESSKLNLNTLLSSKSNSSSSSSSDNADDDIPRKRLLALPEMTEEIADAILDWVDEDDRERQYGTESFYYQSLDPPYSPRNGPLVSVDELLNVRGVTRRLLYGEDINRNGLLDPNENDGDRTPPADNADGSLDLGWRAYLTVHSKELNLRDDGSKRINVNQSDLDTLFEQLKENFSEDVARFVVAYRRFGAFEEGKRSGTMMVVEIFSSSISIPPKNKSGNQYNSGGVVSSGLTFSVHGLGTSASDMKWEVAAAHDAKSLFDLVGIQVKELQFKNGVLSSSGELLDSPWSDDPARMRNELPLFLDALSMSSERMLKDRINISQARKEVLATIPEMTDELAETIQASQNMYAGDDLRETSAWPLIEGYLTLEQMRKFDPYMTGGGDVFRVQIIGSYDAGGPYSRLEAIIDATYQPPKLVFRSDLISELGRGYSQRLLSAGME